MRFVPHRYQQYSVERIVSDPCLGLFQAMGLGKTVITLTAINELKYNRWAVARVLVIAPKKVAEATWAKEAEKWDHLRHLRIVFVGGTAAQRVAALHTPADIWVISRDNTAWLVDYYRNAWPFDMVVLDESSSFKNHQAKRFKALKLVRPLIRRLVLLTGTPAPNGLTDLWAQVYLLDGGQRLGRTISQYRDEFFLPDKRNQTTVFSYKPRGGAAERIRAAISDLCISMKAEDYLELPDYVEHVIPVALDTAARKAYKKLERELLLEVDESTITAGTAAVLNNKLLQLCNGAVYDNAGGVTRIHDCKLEAFLETVEGLHGAHALVFYSYRHDIDRIQRALGKSGLRVRVYQGAQDEADWNAGEIDLLLAHPASCGYGLNLQQGGHHVIWFGLTWSLEQYQQANKRLHRQGQEYPVVAHHLIVQGGLDEDVMAALAGKGDTQEALMQALKARIQAAKEEA